MAAHILFVTLIDVFIAASLFASAYEQIVDECCQIRGFQLDCLHSCLQCAVIGNSFQAFCVIGGDFLFAGQNMIESSDKAFFETFFFQRGCLALFTFLEFVITVPPPTHVFCIRVPFLSSIKASAVTTNNTAGENGYALGASASSLTSSELLLDHFKNFWTNYSRMIL